MVPRKCSTFSRGGRWLLPAAAALIFISGCATRPAPISHNVPAEDLSGTASWYGRPYHGRPTANGETYDMEGLTAAHRTLPFNSEVRVRRQDNGSRVDVRINDRGPFVKGRVIDLSRGAARRLGILRKGVAPVRLEPLRIPPDPRARWLILVGGFERRAHARRFSEGMRQNGTTARIVPGWHGDTSKFHVQLRGYRRESRARARARRLRRQGYGAFLVRTR